MEKYLIKLIEQYKSATGTKKVDINSKKFINEFTDWLKTRKIMGKKYTSFINYMGVEPTIIGEESVEIGKGKLDSIALDTGIYMITPYFEGIKIKNAGIINADFEVYDGIPNMIKHNKDGNQIKVVDSNYIRRFLTHNPYEQNCIRNWHELHNKGKNITVGVFGSIYDKDTESKIRQIKNLRDKLNDSYKEDYAVFGEDYCYAISSDEKKVKRLVKTLTR